MPVRRGHKYYSIPGNKLQNSPKNRRADCFFFEYGRIFRLLKPRVEKPPYVEMEDGAISHFTTQEYEILIFSQMCLTFVHMHTIIWID